MGENQVQQGLCSQSFEHDNCGIGAVVNIKGRKDHQIVADALKIVEQLEHRAGKDAEEKPETASEILTQISHRFFQSMSGNRHRARRRKRIRNRHVLFPAERLKRSQAKKMFEIIVEKEGMKFLGWREVPTAPEVLGHKARECMPVICQGFVKKPENIAAGLDFDRKLYVVRRVFEQSNDNTYVPSLSSRTIVYKGMFLVGQLRTFFKDLQDAEYDSAIAIVHSRFSTNTNPSWERAHPNRFIVHNG
ncbi:MAG: glutamate synthase subunit alpha, partial [Gallintestinimicrobium sp.]